MTQPHPTICPYLGLVSEPATARTEPSGSHRCYAGAPAQTPDAGYQAEYCLTAQHGACPIYQAAGEQAPPGRPSPSEWEGGGRGRQLPPRRQWLPWAVLAVLALAVAGVYARDLFRADSPAAAAKGDAVAAAVVRQAATPSPTALPARTALPANSPIPPASGAQAAQGNAARGRTVTLAPKPGDAGWFASGEPKGNHLGDSFLYAGYFDGKAFISAARISLADVPRGAPILSASLELTGLSADRFDANAGGTWSVQLLPADAFQDFGRLAFQEVFNAPPAISLIPTLFASDLAAGKPNTFSLDEVGRAWLAQQLLDGKEAVVARITGPTGGSPSLFAYDSGAGPATLGTGPRLVLSLGSVPATVPPLPTEAVIVATLTPTPANALTAVAYAWEATAQAMAGGATPLPYRIVTPTPPAGNLATAQAYVAMQGLSPLVVYTPTPANEATAEADALYATAVAVTTGTFTPVPTNAVTPVIILPTIEPKNAATALVQALTATTYVRANGTPTPWPANVLIATRTPTPVTPTATAANAATAAVRAAEATLTAMARSAQTPVLGPPAGAGGRNLLTPAPPAAGPPLPTLAAGPSPTRTLAPPRTPTPTAPRLAATPTPRAPTAQPRTPAVASPALLAPQNGEQVAGLMTFRWQASSSLPPRAKYEVVWWNAGEDPANARGIAPPTLDTALSADLRPLAAGGGLATSDLYWTVIVVTEGPYVRLTSPAGGQYWVVRYTGPSAPPRPAAPPLPKP